METSIERKWRVDTGDSVFEADAETLSQWIWEGSILPHHRVSRGGPRWLEAGKVPQFAEHFATAREMKDLLGDDAPPARTFMPPMITPPAPQMDDRYALPSEKIAAAPTPFGIKLMASSAVAVIIAILGGYLWAYQVSSPRDFASMKNEPKIIELQAKFDKDKAVIEQFRDAKPAVRAVTSAPAPVASKLGPDKTGKIAGKNEFGIEFPDVPTYTPPTMSDFSEMMPKHDYDGDLKNLTAQFERDKSKVVADIRAADSKTRFPVAAFALFLGLGGLNFARLKLFAGK